MPEDELANTKRSNASDVSNRHRRSSLFARARKSFFRTGGARGADTDTIRGNTGADFEGNAVVTRTALDSISCSCAGSLLSYKATEHHLLVKGPFCFVYNLNDESSPKYAISLQSMKPTIENETTVVLESTADKISNYHFTIEFKDKEIAIQFAKVVQEQSSSAQIEQVRRKLGHASLIQTRSSIVYAKTIALNKIDDQPSEPITVQEVLSIIPTSTTQM